MQSSSSRKRKLNFFQEYKVGKGRRKISEDSEDSASQMILDVALFNFILYNFRRFALKSNIIFHCWSTAALFRFSQLSSDEGVYSQFVNMAGLGPELNADLESSVFRFQRPIVGVFLDLNCPRADEVLNASSYLRLFNEHFHWLIYDREENISRFEGLFKRANLSVNADLVYAISQDNLSENGSAVKLFTLYDVYNNGKHIGGKLNMTLDRKIICTTFECQFGSYLSDLYKRPKFGNRNRQSDITLRVAVMITCMPIDSPELEKLQFLVSENNTSVDVIPRFGYRQVILLRNIFQCNLSLSFFDRWSSGETDGGGVGALLQEKVDICSTPNAMTTERFKVFSALAETSTFHSSCIFRTPRTTGLGNGGEVFLEPFAMSVWILFGLLLLLTSIFLWGVFGVERRRMKLCLKYAPSLLTSVLITFGTACIQGTYIMPRSSGGRMAYAALAFASFMMYNYYTSVIVSILLGDPIKSDIKTLSQLADSPLEVGFDTIPFNIAYLNYSTIPAIRRLVKRKIDTKKNRQSVFMSTEEGVLRVRDEPGFVFGLEASSGFALVEKHFRPEEICDLNEIFLRPERSLAAILRKDSSYKELLRLRLTRLLETGINRRHLQYWLRDRLNCFSKNLVVEVGLEYTGPLFILLLGAYVFSAIIVLLERMWKFYGVNKLQQFCCEMQL